MDLLLSLQSTVLFLLVILLIAAATDMRSRKIPNLLILVGLIGALALQYYENYFSGVTDGLIGIAIAFVITIPFVAMRALGAGDSKLILIVGAALGVWDMITVLLLALVTAGLFGLIASVLKGRFGAFRDNISISIMSIGLRDWDGAKVLPGQTAYRVPFAVPVAVAAAVWLYWFY